MERPFFRLLLPMICGLSTAPFFAPVSRDIVLPLIAIAFLSAFLRNRLPFFVAGSLLLFVWGNLSLQPLLHPQLPPHHIARYADDEPVIVEGIVDSRPEATEKGERLYLEAERICRQDGDVAVTGRLLLSIGERRMGLMTGDRVRFSSRIRKPRNFGMPGEFDYVRFLAFRNVFVTAFVKRGDDVILMRQGVAYPVQRRIDAVAASMGRFIEQTLPAAEGGILRALLLGERGYVAKETEDEYARTGVNHILSISGFHVGIIAVVVFQFLLYLAGRSEKLLLYVNLRRITLVITLPVLVLYLFLTGAAPATSRSVIMIGAFIVALLLEREVDPINSLMLAAFIILGLTPPALFDISFQLSFLALWGILVLTPLFMTPFQGMAEGFLRKGVLLMMASAAATVATLLPVAYYFHRASLTGLISNLFVVPLMGYGAVVIGFAALPFIYLVPAVAKALLMGAAFLVTCSNQVIAILARIPPLTLVHPTRLDLFLLYLVLTTLTFVKGRGIRCAVSGAAAVVYIGAGIVQHHPDAGELKVFFFSVGQGESSFIVFPGGKTMLVDGGGSPQGGGPDVGERLIAPALWRLGVSTIDYLVLTHPHPDHLQGLRYVAAHFRIGEFWEGTGHGDSEDYRELMRALAAHRVPVHVVDASTKPFTVGDVTIEPLAPLAPRPTPILGQDVDLNEESLAFRLVSGRFAVLFTGDMGHGTEERLMSRPDKLTCTVLKVPHHGSRHSNSLRFFRATAPEFAVVSVGYGNSFHLPARETLKNLETSGIRLYRTDLDGTVVVTYDVGQEKVAIRTESRAF